MNGYRKRILGELQTALADLGRVDGVLDVGAGDGWFAMSIEALEICNSVTAIDIKSRPQPYHSIQLYEGARLPFDDAAFDLVYAIDVVHHAPDPAALLAEMARCTRRILLIKDHTWHTMIGWLVLAARDEISNRPNGIRCMYKFQRNWEWDVILRANGLQPLKFLHPLHCHSGPLGRFLNQNEFVTLWQVIPEEMTLRNEKAPVCGF